MFFIYKDEIANYRFAIAKEVFTRIYLEYSFIEDVPKSNCMKCFYNNEVCIVSLFSLPNIENDKGTKVYSFYLAGGAYKKVTENNSEKLIHILKFTKEFCSEYNKSFEQAIKAPEQYMKSKGKIGSIFYKGILLKHEDVDGIDELCYKYYSDEKIQNNKHNVVDGNISFADPNTFNDPFDVNCSFANNVDMSNLFRIFCVAPNPREILMWSYYASEHKGYCFEYKKQDILKQILNYSVDGICIIGEVEYKDKRPKQKSSLNAISFKEINFYIQAAFTKFEEWEHEKEFRFVLLSDTFSSGNSRYQEFNIPVYKIYEGVKGKGQIIKNGKGNIVNTIRISKDSQKYKLM